MVPYEMAPQGGLLVQGGEVGCFALAFASRARITKLIVVQTSGVAVNFTAALYNRLGVCAGHTFSESVGVPAAGGGALPPEVWRVSPDLAGTAGVLEYFSDQQPGGQGLTFVGQDADRLGRGRKIYLRISPQGTGPKQFAVALGGFSYGGN
jgi:NADPH:quinone reductase-like Zn-dependent oxidoreductase